MKTTNNSKIITVIAIALTLTILLGCGIPGPIGPQGPKGDQGLQGSQGMKGDTGSQGAQGAQGLQGEKGVSGAGGATYELAYEGNSSVSAKTEGDTTDMEKKIPVGFLRSGGRYMTVGQKTTAVFRIQFSFLIKEGSNHWVIPREVSAKFYLQYGGSNTHQTTIQIDKHPTASKGNGLYEIVIDPQDFFGPSVTTNDLLDLLGVEVTAKVYSSGATNFSMITQWYWKSSQE